MKESDAAAAAVTAIVVRSSLPAWLRWGWAALVTVASLGGWVVDHCYPPGVAGELMKTLRIVRERDPSKPVKAGERPTLPPSSGR